MLLYRGEFVMYRTVVSILFLSFFLTAGNAQPVGSPMFFPAVNTFKVTDVQLQKDVVISKADKHLLLFVFMSPECPLCQNYTKIINGIQKQYNQQVEVYAIVPGVAYTAKDITVFQKKYHTSFSFFIDKKMALTKYLQATVTPQVILLDNKMQLVYTGAVDNWAISVGKKRAQASQHYLADAIEQSIRKMPVSIASTKPVGCKINDY